MSYYGLGYLDLKVYERGKWQRNKELEELCEKNIQYGVGLPRFLLSRF